MSPTRAFTLVEILIVVVILGILSAIVVPQFTSATRDAMAGNLQDQLTTLNNQLELYKARNNAQLPPNFVTGGGDAPWSDLVAQGYLKASPINPACPSVAAGGDPKALVVGAGTAGTANVGWNYDTTTNTLLACYFDEVNRVVTSTP